MTLPLPLTPPPPITQQQKLAPVSLVMNRWERRVII
jgi:hypothetical protein